ncbi:MAG: hypothetical protein QM669_09915 [Siphonobacter sp.]
MVLVEVDDYAQAQKFVTEIKKYTGLVGSAATFLSAAELTNPIGYVLLSLQAAGIMLEHRIWFDKDDVLGAKEYSYEELRQGLPRRVIPLKFSQKSRLDSYDYDLRLGLTLN